MNSRRLSDVLAVSAGALMFYLLLFWALPYAAFSSPLAISRPEAMGCTLTEYIIGFHILIAFIVWISFGASNLTRAEHY